MTDYDYWMDLPDAATDGREVSPASGMAVETIEDVQALETRHGAAMPPTVPPALREPLFGRLDIAEGPDVPHPHTYAILDAAKVPGLPEVLEASGLEHDSLFMGCAAEELRDVAPYLARLEEGTP